MTKTTPPSPERVLIVRPSALGDVCRSVPVLASLRAAYPSAHIDWLVNDRFRDAVAHHPLLDGIVEFPRSGLSKDLRAGRFQSTARFLKQLRAGGYDLVLDAQGLLRSGFFSFVTGSRTRVGFAHAGEGAWAFYNRRVRCDRGAHAVDRMLALLEPLGVPPIRDLRLFSGQGDRDWLLGEPGLSTRYAVLAPTSAWASKRWPIERFTALTDTLLETGAVESIAIVGAPNERAQCRPLLEAKANDTRVIDLVGKTSVGRLMAVIERSALVVANDSAALHIAVGFRRPYVAIYGPTSVDRVGPASWGQRGADTTGVVQRVTPRDALSHKSPKSVELIERVMLEDVMSAAARALVAAETES